MTQVTVRRSCGHIVGLAVIGHSESVEPGEPDLVCAAVSVLVQALHIGLVDVLGLDVDAHTDDSTAFIEMNWQTDDMRADAIAQTIVQSLKETAKSYPYCLKLTEVS